MTKKVGFLVGSLRKDSFNKKVANTIIELLPEGYVGEILEIGDLPHYNEDFDSGVLETPESYVRFRNQLDEFESFIFVTPEYNRSVPSVLKNAIDVATRPWGQIKWAGKPAAVVSSSIGQTGGMKANYELKKPLLFSNMHVMGQPEVMLGAVHESFDEEGNAVERTREFLNNFTNEFVKFVEEHRK